MADFGDIMKYKLEVDGLCNGEKFRVDGEGFTDMTTGMHKIKAYCPEGTKLPMSWVAIGPVLQYGSMAFVKYDHGIKDWFKEQLTTGNQAGYKQERKFIFHSGGTFTANHFITRDGDTIFNKLTLTVEGFDPNGAVMSDNILSIETGIQMCSPDNGGMRALCSFYMNRKDGGIETASSDSLYTVPGRLPENYGVMPVHHGCIVKLSHSKDCSDLRDHIVGEEYIRGFNPEKSIQNMLQMSRSAQL